MGHSDVSTTMNVYTHLKFDDAKNELKSAGLYKPLFFTLYIRHRKNADAM